MTDACDEVEQFSQFPCVVDGDVRKVAFNDRMRRMRKLRAMVFNEPGRGNGQAIGRIPGGKAAEGAMRGRDWRGQDGRG